MIVTNQLYPAPEQAMSIFAGSNGGLAGQLKIRTRASRGDGAA
jgi:hypothetical protein